MNEVGLWPPPERLDHRLERPWEVEVVAVEVGQDLARGQAHALVDRVVHAPVGLRQPAHVVGALVAAEDVEGSVGRAAVNDDVLEAVIGLSPDRVDRRLDEPALVERRRDDRHKRAVRHHERG